MTEDEKETKNTTKNVGSHVTIRKNVVRKKPVQNNNTKPAAKNVKVKKTVQVKRKTKPEVAVVSVKKVKVKKNVYQNATPKKVRVIKKEFNNIPENSDKKVSLKKTEPKPKVTVKKVTVKKNENKIPQKQPEKITIEIPNIPPIQIQKPQPVPNVTPPKPTAKAANPYIFRSSEKYDKNLVLKSSPESPEKPFPFSMIPSSRYSASGNIRRSIFWVSFVVMVSAAILIGVYFWSNFQSEKQNEELQNIYTAEDDDVHDDSAFSDSVGKNGEGTRLKGEYNEDEGYKLLPGAARLLKISQDVKGYIEIPDTKINYPVMQGDSDNEEYLKKDIYGKWKYAGSIFMDFRDKFDEVRNAKLYEPNSGNIVIYGHNMRDESMFGSLRKYINDDDYYEKHPIIYLNSNYKQYAYKIYGFFIADPTDKTDTFFDYWDKIDFSDKDDFYDYIDEIKRRTIKNTNVDMQYGDELLTLSTCNNNLVNNGRFVIAARKCRDGEDMKEGTTDSSKNKNVKMPSSYYSGKSTYNEKEFKGYERK